MPDEGFWQVRVQAARGTFEDFLAVFPGSSLLDYYACRALAYGGCPKDPELWRTRDVLEVLRRRHSGAAPST